MGTGGDGKKVFGRLWDERGELKRLEEVGTKRRRVIAGRGGGGGLEKRAGTEEKMGRRKREEEIGAEWRLAGNRERKQLGECGKQEFELCKEKM